MEDGLVPQIEAALNKSVNSLNPCCDGRWSRTPIPANMMTGQPAVLILVVMEDGLVRYGPSC